MRRQPALTDAREPRRHLRITVAIAERERNADRMNDPAEWIDDARTKIAALHGQRLALCDELLRYVLERLRPWSGRGLDLD